MTSGTLRKAIDNIDDKLIAEACGTTAKAAAQKRTYKYLSIAAAFILCVALTAIGISISHSHISEGGKNVSVIEKTPSVVEGNGYTRQQINELVEANKEIIALTVSAQYNIFGKEINIYTVGYSHAACGKKNIVNRDYLTLPVCVDGKIVANIEVFTSNKEVLYTLNVGGERWDEYNRVFDENPNEKIVFLFEGGALGEGAMAPNNKRYAITTYKSNLDNSTDWYSLLKTEYNSFSKKDLLDSSNYITVISKETETGKAFTSDTILGNEVITTAPNTEHDTQSPPILSNKIPDGSTITLSTELNEQMGKEAISLNDKQAKAVIEKISLLEPAKTSKPDNNEFPTGGGIIVNIKSSKNENIDRYVFISENIIQFNSEYYADKSGAYESLISQITEILYNAG